MSFTPIYGKNLNASLCYVDTIQLNEFSVTGYVYSGITLTFNYSGFTSHFNTTGHTYSNVILNNDVYTYTGITDETHYFEIYDFYSDGTPSIDPLLTEMTEANVISGFTTNIIPCTSQLIYSGNCCPIQVVKSNLPWVAITNEGGGADNCEPFIARRTEKGWTLDFVFNKDGLPWTNSVFFYTGVRDEYDPANYGDNNLSFAFTDDGRIKWTSYRYSGYCDTVSGYTEMYYISTGQTFPLCTNGTSTDFNITITFERYNEYTTDCELANEGGWNDLINTGVTSTTGSTIIVDTQIEQLNSKWLNERKKRLGTLKIYHNGRPLQIEVPLSPISNFRNLPVYKVKDFEEIVLSDRGFQPFTHCVGGGVTGSGNLHNSVCCYSIKYVAYFEDIITAQDIRDMYLNSTKLNNSITECWEDCVDVLSNII